MKKILVIMLLSFVGKLMAQEQITVIEKHEPRSILKVGTAPIGFMNHAGVDVFNLSLAYEFKVMPRITAQVQLISNLFDHSTFDKWDVESYYKNFSGGRVPFYKQNAVTLNADFRYYLSKEGFRQMNGAYIGLRINNLFTNGLERTNEGSTQIRTAMLPATGLYFGYQKTFANNMFIDANIGFVPKRQFRFVQNDLGLPLDLNLSFGYRFKSHKSKEQRRLEKLRKGKRSNE